MDPWMIIGDLNELSSSPDQFANHKETLLDIKFRRVLDKKNIVHID